MLNSEQRKFQILSNSFFHEMIGVNYKIAMVDTISDGRKYCIALDDRQHSYAQA